MAKAKPKQPIDFPILFFTLALIAFGLIMVMNAASVSGLNSRTQNAYYYVSRQMIWALIGSAAMLVAIFFPLAFWRRFAGIGILVSIGMLAMVISSEEAGVTVAGAARWLEIGGLRIQPSEIAKLTLVLLYAHILDRYPVVRGKKWRVQLGILLPVTLLILYLVYKQPDLGTAIVLAATCGVMLLQTEIPAVCFFAAVPVMGGVLFHFIQGYQKQRIMVWLDPWKYASIGGYQITNAEIAFGSGGLLGVGLGRSMQKYGFLPETHTDMIFAIVGEELGLVGCLFLLLLVVSLYARAYYVIRRCQDRFARLLGFGLISALAIQTMVNLSVVTGVLPLTGITLPLISYGGSSLLITMFELGLVLNITRYCSKTVAKRTGKPPVDFGVNSA